MGRTWLGRVEGAGVGLVGDRVGDCGDTNTGRISQDNLSCPTVLGSSLSHGMPHCGVTFLQLTTEGDFVGLPLPVCQSKECRGGNVSKE